MVTTNGRGKLEWIGMKVWKFFSEEGFSLELTGDLEA
jgi:hypothetical protein